MTTFTPSHLEAARTVVWQMQPERLSITIDLAKAPRWLFEQCEAIGGESLVQKAALMAFRAYALDQFRRLKNRIEAYQQTLEPALTSASNASGLTQAGLFQKLGGIHADSEISPGNEHWVANMERAYHQLEKHMDQIEELIDACTLADLDETEQATSAC